MRGIIIMVSLILFSCGGDPRHVNEYFTDPDVVELIRAEKRGNVERVDAILKSGVDVNYRGKHGVTPLFWVALTQKEINAEGFELLLKAGADCNVMNDSGRSLLYITIQKKRTTALRLCLQYGGNPNLYHSEESSMYQVPILYAIFQSDLDHLKVLVEYGANIEVRNSLGDTPLTAASKVNLWDMVHFLLINGADYKIGNNNGTTIIYYLENNRIGKSTEQYKHRKMVIDFLRERGVEVDPWEPGVDPWER